MSYVKGSQLPSVTTVADTDTLIVTQEGDSKATKKVAKSDLLKEDRIRLANVEKSLENKAEKNHNHDTIYRKIEDSYSKTEIDNKNYLTEHQDITGKQDKLTAGTNITIGDDNTISATGGVKVDSELSDTSENPVQNKVVKAALDATYNPTNKEDLNKIGHDEKGNLTYNEVVVGGSSITVDAELNSTSENPVQNKVINAKLDEVFQSVSNGKSLLETAITDKGSSVSKAGDVATFEELKTGIVGISTGVCELNIFTQTTEPSTKDGLWLKTSNIYDDVLNISDTEYSDTPDTYTKMTDIPYEFYSGSAVAIGNDIYLLGGGSSRTNNYKYDTTTNTYNKLTDIPYELSSGSAVAIGNDIYLLGSNSSANSINNYKYDTTTNTYTQMANIPYEFYYGSAVSVGNDIYLLCGYDNRKNNYKYDTTTNTYTKMADIPYEFYYGSAVAIGNDIYLLGGVDSKTNNYKYNTTTDTYNKLTDIPYEFRYGSAVAIGNDIYLLGGYDKKKYNYRYDTINIYKNSILFLYNNIPFKYKTKIFNTSYEGLNYISFDSVIMTDENCNNTNVEVYIGNGTSWDKI